MPSAKRALPIEAGADLPDLTPQQMHFVEGILAGKTASDAYRDAYDCSNSKPTTVNAEASRLRAHPNIATWIAEARKAHLGKAVLTVDEHMLELARLREIAIERDALNAAVSAEHLRGKVAGHYTERIEVTRNDPASLLAQIERIDHTIAKRLAERFQLSAPALTIDAEPAVVDDEQQAEPV